MSAAICDEHALRARLPKGGLSDGQSWWHDAPMAFDAAQPSWKPGEPPPRDRARAIEWRGIGRRALVIVPALALYVWSIIEMARGMASLALGLFAL